MKTCPLPPYLGILRRAPHVVVYSVYRVDPPEPSACGGYQVYRWELAHGRPMAEPQLMGEVAERFYVTTLMPEGIRPAWSNPGCEFAAQRQNRRPLHGS